MVPVMGASPTHTETVQVTPAPAAGWTRGCSPHTLVGTRVLGPTLGRTVQRTEGTLGRWPVESCLLAFPLLLLRYPLYQLGNPQLRVFRTNFFIRLVRPGTAQPEDTVQFRIPMEMTRVDLRNYLERIYNVPVATVRTRVQHGSNRKRDHRNVRVKRPDYKVAYVQLAHGQTFTFPDLFPEKEQSPDGSPSGDDIQDKLLEEQRQRQRQDPRRGGVPSWFGL
ncbi:39S ribosomal protein L23, mitochondrial isoform X1 [Meles meles]|uniref:39S ribosomal protein L23, mitochondrial isoform X1 n=1 Tax=Meles meles TaxID=9662 RepID=UPI001E6A0AA6|nr:39S ribosomal protein L23, mitochondrial isoform X1 [Meles meles]